MKIIQFPSLLYPAYVQDYLDRVTAADVAAGNTSGLELGVTDAISSFLQDLVSISYLGISGNVISQAASTIKQYIVHAGARTLSGALVPIVGPAPTNVGFLAPDYNRKTGLKGNAVKYLNTNTAPNSVAQNNAHLSVYITQAAATNNTKYMGSQNASNNAMRLIDNIGTLGANINSSSGYFAPANSSQRTGLIGASVNPAQAAANQMSVRFNSATITAGNTINSTLSLNMFVFARNLNGSPNQGTDARISAWTFGQSLALNLIEDRIITLTNSLSSAIP